MEPAIEELVGRSLRLGADSRYTNFGGGNTSVKATVTDPLGQLRRVLYVKGSGGDLGTLTPDGLAALDLDRLAALRGVYRGPDHEDEMVGLLEHCCYGSGGAAPSIDTAMHGLVAAAHVDHLHPDSVIALATAADGERLAAECYGDDVAWVPWRRPGFELGCHIADLQQANPRLRGVVLGGHGLTAWGATSDECEHASLDLIARAAQFIAERGKPEPFGPKRLGYTALPSIERRTRAARLAPYLRGLAGTDRQVVGHFIDDAVVTDLLAGSEAPRLAALGTSCPDHFLRTKVRPLLLDLPTTADPTQMRNRLEELHAAYRADYRAYYDRHADADTPPMRGADPAIILIPGVGMFSFGADKQTARLAGAYYVNAINVMRGAEALSTYQPIDEEEKFRIEYWALEEAKLRRRPAPTPLTGKVGFVTGAASGIGLATARALADNGACVVVSDRDSEGAHRVAKELGDSDVAIGCFLDVTDEPNVEAAVAEAVLAFGGIDIIVNNAGTSLSRALVETTADDWDALHDILARGSFLVSRATARVLEEQGYGGDIVYVVSKNSVAAGPANIAYAAAKADQAHQVRLLAAELGAIGVRVNGVNPDGVVAGSGIFANGWGADRAAVYGVPEDKLGEFYAQRTLLKREVLPEHVADAIMALVGGLLSQTTGTHVPVDGGVPGAFLR